LLPGPAGVALNAINTQLGEFMPPRTAYAVAYAPAMFQNIMENLLHWILRVFV